MLIEVMLGWRVQRMINRCKRIMPIIRVFWQMTLLLIISVKGLHLRLNCKSMVLLVSRELRLNT